MSRDFPERDWKHFRGVHVQARDRFCARTLAQAQGIVADPARTSHERYLDLYRLMRERDQQMAQLFDDLRRSTAWVALLSLIRTELVSAEELAGFSESTRSFLAACSCPYTGAVA